ncbi:Uncharacterised protein [Mycobacteroides abscessus subsp. abscessus]|nr:Uncharacterised protein [Mycobacteroides abscessus subsp. abscessus]
MQMPAVAAQFRLAVGCFHNPRDTRDIEPFRITHDLGEGDRTALALHHAFPLTRPVSRPEH